MSQKKLLEIRSRPGNDNECAECGCPDPEWTSYSLGVFLCLPCCGIHRSLGTHLSKVKGLKLDKWDNDQVEMMDSKGNDAATDYYLKFVPSIYPRPTKDAIQLVREQWIRAKYERQEFVDRVRQSYLTDTKEGYLWKKGRDDAKFLQRKFKLCGRNNQLSYFVKEGPKASPKAVIPLDDLNCCFTPEKMGNQNGMQISYEKDGAVRNIYVYAEDGKEIMDWYLAIRFAKLTRLKVGLPHMAENDLISRLSCDFTLEGWLWKTGPNPRDAWRRRWCTLHKRKLIYADDPLSAYSKGEVFIGHKEDDFSLMNGVPTGRNDHTYSFTLRVPDRDYPLAASSQEDRDEWICVLEALINTPLSSQDGPMRSKHVRLQKKTSLFG